MDGRDQPYAPSNPQPPVQSEQPPAPESKSAQNSPEIQPAPKETLSAGYQHQSSFRRGWIYLAVLVLILSAAAGYWFLVRDKNGPVPSAGPQSSGQNPASTQVSAQITSQAKNYSSTKQKLSFDYPQDWAVSETSGLIKVISPPIKLVSAADQNVNGQITFQIRAKSAALPEFADGSAKAAIAPQKIKYTSPSQAQRSETYVSFLQYAGTSLSGIDGVYVTGNFGYKAGQSIPKTDFASADPKVTITFNQCADANCLQNPIKLTISKSSWENTVFSAALLNIVKSLSIN